VLESCDYPVPTTPTTHTNMAVILPLEDMALIRRIPSQTGTLITKP